MRDNDHRNAEIVRFRLSGLFCWQIAEAMGISRNTVIGVCHRSGIVMDDARAALLPRVKRGRDHPRSKMRQQAVQG